MGNILIAIAAVIAVLVLVVATRPSTFHLERSITIAASPESAFARVNDFHEWPAWSPYEKRDAQMKRTFAGAPSGTGAIYAWTGNREVGEGRMTIERSDEPSRVSIKLEFFKPFAATNAATFTFVPTAGGTKVTWAMDGQNNFVAKAVHLFIDMDKMVGGDFERGLATLKAVAERIRRRTPGLKSGHCHDPRDGRRPTAVRVREVPHRPVQQLGTSAARRRLSGASGGRLRVRPRLASGAHERRIS